MLPSRFHACLVTQMCSSRKCRVAQIFPGMGVPLNAGSCGESTSIRDDMTSPGIVSTCDVPTFSNLYCSHARINLERCFLFHKWISLVELNWISIRTSPLRCQAEVFHIKRETNVVAHYCTHQANLHSGVRPTRSCRNLAHKISSCPMLVGINRLRLSDGVITVVRCLRVNWNF
jgi:hypothetical protein